MLFTVFWYADSFSSAIVDDGEIVDFMLFVTWASLASFLGCTSVLAVPFRRCRPLLLVQWIPQPASVTPRQVSDHLMAAVTPTSTLTLKGAAGPKRLLIRMDSS
jgi:hypothetical protein